MLNYLHGFAQNDNELIKNDYKNLEEIVIIATELLYSIKQYDWTVLNPINFMMISLLEYALVRAP